VERALISGGVRRDHSGKLFAAELEYGEAFESFRTASHKLDVLTRRLDENDHVDGWPAEIVAWIRQVKPEVEQLREETSKKR
jgi:hypothetical protein